jgi:hypothetical protein
MIGHRDQPDQDQLGLGFRPVGGNRATHAEGPMGHGEHRATVGCMSGHDPA